MKQSEIISGNKLIAKFLGTNKPVPARKSQFYPCEGGIFFPNSADSPDGVPRNFYVYSKLKYHSSWDWLMPVVIKIGGTDWSGVGIHWGTGNTDSFAWCDISWSNFKANFETSYELNNDEQSLIRAVWLAVVEFIKWYNKQKV